MELTSDIDQHAEGADNIDIDLDLTGDNPPNGVDDFMSEEDTSALADLASADAQEPFVANEDKMADDIYAQESSVRDEDIEDAEYTAPEPDDDTVVESDASHQNEQPPELPADHEEFIGDSHHEQDYYQEELNQQEHHQYPTTPHTESSFDEGQLPNRQMERVDPSHDIAEIATGENSERYHFEVIKDNAINEGVVDQSSQTSNVGDLIAPETEPGQTSAQVLSFSLDEEIMTPSDVEESHAQEEDHVNNPVDLHPIVLDYQGDEMFLFPPVDQSGENTATFLLADEQLAYSTIGDLLKACKCVLKESLSEQDELMINFAELDLHISEVSQRHLYGGRSVNSCEQSTVECASIRLSDVLHLYLRLQQNDGLENPPPLYMDLTACNRFSHRLNVLRKASLEGTGLSQLRSSHGYDIGQQNRTEREINNSNHTAVLSTNELSASEQDPEELEGSTDLYDSKGQLLPSENLALENDSVAHGPSSYYIKDAAYKVNDRLEPLLGGNSNPEAGLSGGESSEIAGFKEPPELAPPLADDSKVRRTEESIVDDTDFIDYEDVEELEANISSASSTLQGDTIDLRAIQDHAAPNKPILAQDQEHTSTRDGQQDAVAGEKTSYTRVDNKDTNNCDVSVEEGRHKAAEIPLEESDEKGQIISRHFEEEKKTSKKDQDATTSHGLEPHLVASVDDLHEASAQYEDDVGSYSRDALHEPVDQARADTDFDGETASTQPLDSDTKVAWKTARDDDLGRTDDLKVESRLEEADPFSTNVDNNHVSPPAEVMLRPPLSAEGSVQTQQDDDEITYEDEEYDVDLSHKPVQANNVAVSPGSRKRARGLHENDDALEEDLQGRDHLCGLSYQISRGANSL